ncbi:hypothetical protein ORJ66_15860 [Pseudoalteromonas tunicata]|uniref:hypothetical protein n=1 Tax=Pseudoalteromonas tunicata TaxID=314281 RepID=UPI00273FFEF0|nr:hypothetical protein [Pseudoalteromonas tunicata]MDP5214530.1 hypothetical protein [Pseudoalteromonas tunicata]
MVLSEHALEALSRTGDELKYVYSNIIQALPHSAQTLSGLTHFLGYNRSNAQRILNAVNKSDNGHQVIIQMPGCSGLKDFNLCIKKHNVAQQWFVQAQQITLQFESVIKQFSKSHAQLKRALSDTLACGHTAEKNDIRKLHYTTSKSIMGSSVNTLFSAYVLSESKKNAEFLQEVAIIAKHGIHRAPNAPPFVQFYTHPHPEGFTQPLAIDGKSRIDHQQFQIGVIESFSTPGLLDAYQSYSASNSGIVFNALADPAPFDATFLFSNPDELANPLHHNNHCSSTSISIKNPTEKLVMMVFLDKKIDMKSSVNVGCYQGNQKVEEGKLSAKDMWTEKLPDYPELRIVNLNAPSLQAIAGINIQQYVDFIFTFSQLNKEQFVCYLMEVDYPIWSSTYRIYFEHQTIN